jgi:hypothetical protein
MKQSKQSYYSRADLSSQWGFVDREIIVKHSWKAITGTRVPWPIEIATVAGVVAPAGAMSAITAAESGKTATML